MRTLRRKFDELYVIEHVASKTNGTILSSSDRLGISKGSLNSFKSFMFIFMSADAS